MVKEGGRRWVRGWQTHADRGCAGVLWLIENRYLLLLQDTERHGSSAAAGAKSVRQPPRCKRRPFPLAPPRGCGGSAAHTHRRRPRRGAAGLGADYPVAFLIPRSAYPRVRGGSRVRWCKGVGLPPLATEAVIYRPRQLHPRVRSTAPAPHDSCTRVPEDRLVAAQGARPAG